MPNKIISNIYIYLTTAILCTVIFSCTPLSKPDPVKPINPLTLAEKGIWIAKDSVASCLLIGEDSSTLFELIAKRFTFWPHQLSLHDSSGKYLIEPPYLPKLILSQDTLLNEPFTEVFYDKALRQILLIAGKDTSFYEYLIKETNGLRASIKDFQQQLETGFWEETSDFDSSAYLIFSYTEGVDQYIKNKGQFSNSETIYQFMVKLQKGTVEYLGFRDKRSLWIYREDNMMFLRVRIRRKYTLYMVENIRDDQIKLRSLDRNGEEVYWTKIDTPSDFLKKTNETFIKEMDRLR